MKTNINVKICNSIYTLRSISVEDTEVLRKWKNEHREYFFYKKEISKQEQQLWFEDLARRNEDHMFIILDTEKPIGCIGIRLYQEVMDIYNVILGDKEYKGKHVMTNALWAVVAFSNLVYATKPVRVRVLRNNPAIKWYQKIGFTNIDFFEDHILLQFNNNLIEESFDFLINITLPIK